MANWARLRKTLKRNWRNGTYENDLFIIWPHVEQGSGCRWLTYDKTVDEWGDTRRGFRSRSLADAKQDVIDEWDTAVERWNAQRERED